MAFSPVRIFRPTTSGGYAARSPEARPDGEADRGSGGGLLRRLAVGAALLMVVLFFALPGQSLAAAYGERIVNSARFVSAQHGTIDASVTVRIVFPTPSQLDILAYAPG